MTHPKPANAKIQFRNRVGQGASLQSPLRTGKSCTNAPKMHQKVDKTEPEMIAFKLQVAKIPFRNRVGQGASLQSPLRTGKSYKNAPKMHPKPTPK